MIVDGRAIVYSKSALDLGVIIDGSLTWKEQRDSTCRRVFRGLHRLIKVRHLLPTITRKHLISSLIMPHFDYCCLVCGYVSEMCAVRLDRVMNACVRFIYDVRSRAHISPYYAALGWFRASGRGLSILGKFIFGVFSSLQPA